MLLVYIDAFVHPSNQNQLQLIQRVKNYSLISSSNYYRFELNPNKSEIQKAMQNDRFRDDPQAYQISTYFDELFQHCRAERENHVLILIPESCLSWLSNNMKVYIAKSFLKGDTCTETMNIIFHFVEQSHVFEKSKIRVLPRLYFEYIKSDLASLFSFINQIDGLETSGVLKRSSEFEQVHAKRHRVDTMEIDEVESDLHEFHVPYLVCEPVSNVAEESFPDGALGSLLRPLKPKDMVGRVKGLNLNSEY